MTNTIKKFTEYLDRNIKKIETEVINRAIKRKNMNLMPSDDLDFNKIAQRKNVRRIINVPESKWKSHGEVFISFDELSPMLEEAGLSVSEKAEIIFFMFKKNLATKIVDEEVIGFDFKKLSKYPFVHTTFDEVKDLLCSDWYRKNQSTEGLELSAEDKLKYDEIEKATKECPLDLSSVVTQHKLIKEHYFDKYPNLNDEDIKIIANVLKEYGLAQSIINELIGYLTNKSLPYLQHFLDEIGSMSDQVFTIYKSGLENLFNPKKGVDISKLFMAASLHCWLNSPVEAKESKTVYGGFRYIEAFIGKRFKEKDFTETVLQIAQRNIEYGILDEGKRTTSIMLDSLNFDFFKPSNLPRFRDSFDKIYRKAVLVKTEEKGVRGVTSYDIDDFYHLQYAHQLIKAHYFDKLDTFTKDDVFQICIGFGKAGISLKYLVLIEEHLYAKIAQREALKIREENLSSVTKEVGEVVPVEDQKIGSEKVTAVSKPKATSEEKKESKPEMSKKAYNTIYREMQTYFDFYEMKSIKYLTLDEIIYCMSLMKKINIPDERIEEFIKKAEKANRAYNIDPITRYVELLKKLEYYSDNDEVMSLLNDLKEAYASIIPEETDTFYEEFIASGLTEILGLIPDNHEYEFSASLELVNKADK